MPLIQKVSLPYSIVIPLEQGLRLFEGLLLEAEQLDSIVIPLEQGLRLSRTSASMRSSNSIVIPLEQGLRQIYCA